jgi:ferredoxin-NADP reductase
VTVLGPRLIVQNAALAGPGIRLLRLQDADGWTLPPFQPGAHIDLHLRNGQSRSYSLCNDPAEDDVYVIAVKREPKGRGGSCLIHDALAIGDSVEVSLPRSTFLLAPDASRHAFIAGGIGVTPFLSMAAVLRRHGADFHLHVLFRTDPPLPALLAPLCDSGHATLHDTRAGRPPLDTLLGQPSNDSHVYACGPAGLMEAVQTAGWPAERCHVEHFVPPILPPDPDARDYTLVLARSGRSVNVQAGESVLTALRRIGIAVDTSCEGGICGACRIRWTEGQPVHRDRILSPDERRSVLMACVAGSAGPRLVLDL